MRLNLQSLLHKIMFHRAAVSRYFGFGLIFFASSSRGAAAILQTKSLAQPLGQSPTRLFAQPSKKLPERSVKVYCSSCKTQLFLYKKGGKGSLVKCFKERIVQDFTEQESVCPSCGKEFARPAMIRGKPALKIIGGKAFQK